MSANKDVSVIKENDVWLRIQTDQPNITEELSDYFEIEIPNAQYTPAYKKRVWDGKVRLFHKRTGRIYVGLLTEIRDFLKKSGYSYVLDNTLREYIEQKTYDSKEFDEFISELNLPYEPYDYQKNAFEAIINSKRRIILSPTGSGKSLIIYLVIRFLLQEQFFPIVLIVPTIGLTTQMYNDFQDYSKNNGWNVEDNVHVIAEGSSRNSNKPISVSTWQALYDQPKDFFQKFSVVIVDEAHTAQAQSLKRILEGATETDYRIGLTGTLKDTKTHIMTIKGLLGDIERVSETRDLQYRGILSNIKIAMISFEYPNLDKQQARNLSYQDESKYIITHQKRNERIVKLASVMEKNTLVLTSFVENHGKPLYEEISKINPETYFVDKDTPKDERERIRQIAEERNGVVIVASYQVFSTGVNIKNLHNIIFAFMGKSKIRLLQSIGRGLRQHAEKDKLYVYDFADNLSFEGKNHSMKHMEERYRIYASEGFDVSYRTYDLSRKSL